MVQWYADYLLLAIDIKSALAPTTRSMLAARRHAQTIHLSRSLFSTEVMADRRRRLKKAVTFEGERGLRCVSFHVLHFILDMSIAKSSKRDSGSSSDSNDAGLFSSSCLRVLNIRCR